MSRRLRTVAVLVVAATLAIAGCSTAPPPAPSSTAGPVVARPAGVHDPAVIPSGTAGPAPDCNPRASLRPAGLPAPGAMPAGSTMAAIAKRGRLVVGTDQNTFLYGYRDPASGQIVGFDVDIAREIARAIFGDPNKVQLVAISSAQRIPFLRDGSVDVVAHTMTANCERWRQVSFSTIYYDAGQRVLVAKGSPVTGIGDLGGKKVCAAEGSTSIANIAAAPAHPIPVSVPDWTDCMVMLQQGQVDAISTDDSILAGMAAQDPNVRLVGGRFTSEPYGIGISQQHPDLVRFVNAVLDRMRSDGRWAAIYTRWLGGPAPAPPAAQYRD